eukprot:3556225-Heterocapsa_arctica.AAC.1
MPSQHCTRGCGSNFTIALSCQLYLVTSLNSETYCAPRGPRHRASLFARAFKSIAAAQAQEPACFTLPAL